MILKMKSFNEQFNQLVKVTLSGKQQLNDKTYNNENIQVMDESARSRDFFQDHQNVKNRIEKRYTATRTKSRILYQT